MCYVCGVDWTTRLQLLGCVDGVAVPICSLGCLEKSNPEMMAPMRMEIHSTVRAIKEGLFGGAE